MSTLVIDTIQGRTTAGSVNVRGEGSNNTSLQQGLAKSWCNFNGESTVAIRDSLNVASLTDDGTGDYKTNFSNNMANTNFSGVVISGTVTEGGGTMQRDEEVRGISTSHLGMFAFHTNSEAARDVEYFATSIHGDLS